MTLFAILKKDFYNYFSNASGYIYLTIYILGTGFLFFINSTSDYLNITQNINLLITITIFVSPNIASNLFLKEKLNKTDVLLNVSPISLKSIVLGKYFSALLLHIFASIFTVFCYVPIFIIFKSDIGIYISGVLGTLLFGAAMISIGLFTSISFNKKSLIYLCNLSISSFIIILNITSFVTDNLFIKNFLSAISLINHYNEFFYGIISLKNIIFFFIVSITFIFLTIYKFNFNRLYDR